MKLRNMKNKHVFKDLSGFKIIIEHNTPFTRIKALKVLLNNFKGKNIKL